MRLTVSVDACGGSVSFVASSGGVDSCAAGFGGGAAASAMVGIGIGIGAGAACVCRSSEAKPAGSFGVRFDAVPAAVAASPDGARSEEGWIVVMQFSPCHISGAGRVEPKRFQAAREAASSVCFWSRRSALRRCSAWRRSISLRTEAQRSSVSRKVASAC